MTAYAAMKFGRWDLGGLVKDPSGDEFARFLKSIEDQLAQFEKSRQTLRPDISPAEFEGLMHALEGISEKISISSGYAHLRYYADTSSNEASALVIKMEKLAADIGNRTLFFDLWFKKQVDDENAKRLIDAVPEVYREYLRHKRLVAKYALSEPEEKIISTLDVTGTRALVKIYDKMTSAFEFTMKIKRGRKIVEKKFDNKEKMISFVRSPDTDAREAAYRSLLQVYKKHSGVLGRDVLKRPCGIVDDHDVGAGRLLLDRPLSPDARASLRVREAVARHDAADLLVRLARRDDHALELVVVPRLEEERDVRDGDAGPMGQVRRPVRDAPVDLRVDDRLERLLRGGVLEDAVAERGAVERAALR